ncbi:hypothetical protein KGY72_07040 [Candidatus Bipolaricaulota bacterium]|nr:hypothetical protein [Candidatus Bipolaricaulota bacterium]
MRQIKIVVRKELRYLLNRKPQLGMLIVMAIFLTVYYASRSQRVPPILASPVVFLGFTYGLSMLLFRSEQTNRAVECLFASPLDFKQIFFGKVAAQFLLAFSSELVVFLVTSGVSWVKLAELPTPRTGILILLVVPIWGTLFAGLLALGYIILGNPMLIQIIGIGAVSGTLSISSRVKAISLTTYIVENPLLPVAAGLVGLLAFYYLIDNLDREWVIEKWKHSAS